MFHVAVNHLLQRGIGLVARRHGRYERLQWTGWSYDYFVLVMRVVFRSCVYHRYVIFFVLLMMIGGLRCGTCFVFHGTAVGFVGLNVLAAATQGEGEVAVG